VYSGFQPPLQVKRADVEFVHHLLPQRYMGQANHTTGSPEGAQVVARGKAAVTAYMQRHGTQLAGSQ
jgi:hypothetical protein